MLYSTHRIFSMDICVCALMFCSLNYIPTAALAYGTFAKVIIFE